MLLASSAAAAVGGATFAVGGAAVGGTAVGEAAVGGGAVGAAAVGGAAVGTSAAVAAGIAIVETPEALGLLVGPKPVAAAAVCAAGTSQAPPLPVGLGGGSEPRGGPPEGGVRLGVFPEPLASASGGCPLSVEGLPVLSAGGKGSAPGDEEQVGEPGDEEMIDGPGDEEQGVVPGGTGTSAGSGSAEIHGAGDERQTPPREPAEMGRW